MAIKYKAFAEDVLINASPHEIYEAFLDAKKHAAFTDASAKIIRRVGGSFSVLDGNFNGKILELDEDKKIFQSWRSEEDEWPPNYYSTISLTLKADKNGTKIHFEQNGIPEESFDNIKYCWKKFYWEPLRKFLEKKG